MSETPILPVLDKKTEQIDTSAEHQYYTGQADRDFDAWERGFDTDSRLDLDREETLNPALWADRTAPAAEAPDYARAPKTRAEEVRESYSGATNEQLRASLDAHTKAIAGITGLREHYKLAT